MDTKESALDLYQRYEGGAEFADLSKVRCCLISDGVATWPLYAWTDIGLDRWVFAACQGNEFSLLLGISSWLQGCKCPASQETDVRYVKQMVVLMIEGKLQRRNVNPLLESRIVMDSK